VTRSKSVDLIREKERRGHTSGNHTNVLKNRGPSAEQSSIDPADLTLADFNSITTRVKTVMTSPMRHHKNGPFFTQFDTTESQKNWQKWHIDHPSNTFAFSTQGKNPNESWSDLDQRCGSPTNRDNIRPQSADIIRPQKRIFGSQRPWSAGVRRPEYTDKIQRPWSAEDKRSYLSNKESKIIKSMEESSTHTNLNNLLLHTDELIYDNIPLNNKISDDPNELTNKNYQDNKINGIEDKRIEDNKINNKISDKESKIKSMEEGYDDIPLNNKILDKESKIKSMEEDKTHINNFLSHTDELIYDDIPIDNEISDDPNELMNKNYQEEISEIVEELRR